MKFFLGRLVSGLVGLAAAALLWGAEVRVTDASIVGETVWVAGNEYVLEGLVFVEEGEVLRIEAGTVVKGEPGEGAEASALVVARGGKIYAEGRADAPVIFTALSDDVSDPEDLGATDRGLWGGLIVLGRSTLNSPVIDGEAVVRMNIEGIDVDEPRGVFGGTDEGDDSGVLRYVSIRHGGTLIGADNEINGLTLGAVGSGTVVEFVEVFASLDDGVEFFGGTVNTRYLVVGYCGDDSFDYDQGFRGKGQFWFTIQDVESGDGGEHDGDIDDNSRLPLSRPEIFNATYIGDGADVAGSKSRALRIRDNGGALYRNSIFTDFGGVAVHVDDDAAQRVGAGDIDFQSCLWWGFGGGETVEDLTNGNARSLLGEGTGNVIVDPELRGISRTFDGVLDPRLSEGSPAWGGERSVAVDGFFGVVDFKGAFGDVNWASSWTALGEGGYITMEGAGEPEVVGSDVGIVGFSLEGGRLVIEWEGDVLLGSDRVDGVYEPVEGAVAPSTSVVVGVGSRFFRVE